jgi:hypothetical protein
MKTMKNEKRSEYVTRESILKLLSDNENGSVATAETAAHLLDGDEYLDLEQLQHGVQRAPGSALPMGQVLPRKAVHANTWGKILAQLAVSSSATAHAGT